MAQRQRALSMRGAWRALIGLGLAAGAAALTAPVFAAPVVAPAPVGVADLVARLQKGQALREYNHDLLKDLR